MSPARLANVRFGFWRTLAVFAAAAAIVSAASGVVTGLIIKAGIDRTTARLTTAQRAACQRVNIQAIKDNRSQATDWLVDQFFVDVVAHPVRRQTLAEQRESQEFRAPIVQAVTIKSWTPPIADCAAAVRRHGSSFVLPEPIAFNAQLPPASALTLPGQRPPHLKLRLALTHRHR